MYSVSGITAYAKGITRTVDDVTTFYYGEGDDVSLTLSNTATGAPLGYRYDTYTASAGTLAADGTLTMPDADVTISVDTSHPTSTGQAVSVAYTDADGTLHDGDNAAQAVALDGSEQSLAAGTYFVGLENVNFDHTVNLAGPVTLILADNATMSVGTSSGRIEGIGITGGDLTIYGQSAQSGTLSVVSNDGIITENNIAIHSGTVIVDANGEYSTAIVANGDIAILGGNVTANSSNGDGIFAAGGSSINISGGTVNANAYNANAIYAGGNYTFSWRTPADRITIGAKGLYAPASKTATFSKAFIDEDGNIYSGTLTGSEALALLAGKTLVPYVPEDGYYLVGTMTDLQWQVFPNYQLTQNPANASEYMIQGVPLSNNTGIKTVKVEDGSITTWYKDGMDNEYKITSDGIYNIYFRPNGNSAWSYYYLYVQKVDNPTVSVTFAPEGFATYYNGQCDVTLPAGVKARVITDSGDKLNYLTIADGDDSSSNIVPAGTAVMLQTAASTDPQQKTLTLSAKAAAAYTGTNLLHGSDYQTTTTGGAKYYKLTYSKNNDNFGWYWGAENGASFTIPGHKAWLALPASAAPAFLGLPDYETTSLTPSPSPKGEGSGWYTIDGRKLNGKPTAKGLYINNGIKIIVK